jgi:hypothetical protein
MHTGSAVDLRQHAQPAACEYGQVRAVTRTYSLHRRRTRFPLKVRPRLADSGQTYFARSARSTATMCLPLPKNAHAR